MSRLSLPSDIGVADRDWDLREHLQALPTKADLQQLIAAVELSCKQVIDGMREDTAALG